MKILQTFASIIVLCMTVSAESVEIRHFTDSEQKEFLNSNVKDVATQIISCSDEDVQVNKYIQMKIDLICARYGVANINIEPMCEPEFRISEQVNVFSCDIPTNGQPVIYIRLPPLMYLFWDISNNHSLSTSEASDMFYNTLLVGIGHELDHLAHEHPLKKEFQAPCGSEGHLKEEVATWIHTVKLIDYLTIKGRLVHPSWVETRNALIHSLSVNDHLAWEDHIRSLYGIEKPKPLEGIVATHP